MELLPRGFAARHSSPQPPPAEPPSRLAAAKFINLSYHNIQSLDIDSLDISWYYMVKSIHTKEYAYFVERLRKARLEAGLTQVEVAKKLGRPQSHISNVESGQQRVDIIELKRFAKMYNKDINYFIKE
jgi:DNA-binding XRE family transcriptional regulator